TDLVAGRVDAVLLDHIIAERSLRRSGGRAFLIQPEAVATGHYVGVLARSDSTLRDSANAILRSAMADGSLERIFRSWSVWDDAQANYLRRVAGGASPSRGTSSASTQVIGNYVPALLRAAMITLVLSCLAMGLAAVAGVAIAAGRVYGPSVVRGALATYVEVVRGTPVLLQLFVIYYRLAPVVRLPAFLAAVGGLGLNYA